MTQEGYHKRENPRRSIGYIAEFKDFVAKNPGFMRTSIKLIRELERGFRENGIRSDSLEENGVRVSFGSLASFSDIYKVEFESESFMVKRADSHKEGGFEEFQDSARAREIIEEIPGVETVGFQCGYTNRNTKKNYFISRWVDDQRLDVYIDKIKNESPNKAQELIDRMKVLESLLGGYFEVKDYNAFYDEERDMIILFDLYDERRHGWITPLWI